ncbi:MAG: hypothetical protein JWL71_2644 [Acidobacteria bacterium]|nr:hypothetical protein [Acidobacteriota bacterium]
MRLLALLFTAILTVPVAAAAQEPVSQPAEAASPSQGGSPLPVSLSKIREALETTPLLSIGTIDERPTFRVQIRERQKLDELLATLNFKAGPIPAGGVYMMEQDRIMFPPVDNPLRQPLAAFNQPQLLTILIENLVGKYLGGKALSSISQAERVHAEAAAKEEVRAAVAQYCTAQPRDGAGIQICDTAGR